jgi:hypothetical protein
MRPKHFKEYENMTEVVPGVFVNVGESVHIVDELGEVATWNCDEWTEDPESVTATINAVILATKYGAEAVRQNIESKGLQLASLIDETIEFIEDNENSPDGSDLVEWLQRKHPTYFNAVKHCSWTILCNYARECWITQGKPDIYDEN